MLHFAKWKTIIIWGIALLGILCTLPNFLSKPILDNFPTYLPHKQVHLGLDLQGGSHLLLEMDEKFLTQKWAKTLRGDVRQKLREKRINYVGLVSKTEKC